MSTMVNATKRLAERRKRIIRYLPDTCQIYPFVRVRNAEGGFTDGLGDAIEYDNGVTVTTDIPCRLDATKYYRQGEIFEQETTVGDYMLNLPTDINVSGDVRIILGGKRFEVRKVIEGNSWSVVNRLMVATIDPDPLA